MIYGNYGCNVKLKAKEGNVEVVEGDGAQGEVLVPVYSEPIKKDNPVTLVGDKEVSKADEGDLILGFAAAKPEPPEGTQVIESASYGNYRQRGVTVAIMCSKIEEIELVPGNSEISVNDSIVLSADAKYDKSDEPNATLVLESAAANSGKTIPVAFGYYGRDI